MTKEKSYKEMNDYFYEKYYSVIEPNIIELENIRKFELKNLSKCFLILALTILLGLGMIYFMEELSSIKGVRLFCILVTICCCVVLVLISEFIASCKCRFQKMLNDKVMSSFLNSLGDITFVKNYITRIINSNVLAKHKISEVVKSDIDTDTTFGFNKNVFYGCRNNVDFEIFKNKRNKIFLSFELNKSARRLITVKSKKMSFEKKLFSDSGNVFRLAYLLFVLFCVLSVSFSFWISTMLMIIIVSTGVLISNLQKSFFATSKSKGLNSNEKFIIKSDDEIEAKYLTTPTFIECLDNLMASFKADTIRFSFVENKMIFEISANNRLFEIGDLYSTVLDKKQVQIFFKQIASIFLMIDNVVIDNSVEM